MRSLNSKIISKVIIIIIKHKKQTYNNKHLQWENNMNRKEEKRIKKRILKQLKQNIKG